MSIWRCYSDWLCPKRAYAIRRLEEFKREHSLFRALLHVCVKKDALSYETTLYPVYLIARQFIGAYSQLEYVRIEYKTKNYKE